MGRAAGRVRGATPEPLEPTRDGNPAQALRASQPAQPLRVGGPASDDEQRDAEGGGGASFFGEPVAGCGCATTTAVHLQPLEQVRAPRRIV